MSAVYNSFIEDVNNNDIDPAADTFWIMLTDGYTPNIDTHEKRSDITNEVSGTGYSSGGKAITATVTRDDSLNQLRISFASVNWPSATFDTDGAVIYKRRGGAASADELVAFISYAEGTVTVSSGTLVVTVPTPIIYQNLSV